MGAALVSLEDFAWSGERTGGQWVLRVSAFFLVTRPIPSQAKRTYVMRVISAVALNSPGGHLRPSFMVQKTVEPKWKPTERRSPCGDPFRRKPCHRTPDLKRCVCSSRPLPRFSQWRLSGPKSDHRRTSFWRGNVLASLLSSDRKRRCSSPGPSFIYYVKLCAEQEGDIVLELQHDCDSRLEGKER